MTKSLFIDIFQALVFWRRFFVSYSSCVKRKDGKRKISFSLVLFTKRLRRNVVYPVIPGHIIRGVRRSVNNATVSFGAVFPMKTGWRIYFSGLELIARWARFSGG